MVRVIACVFEQHNLWLVALAALICVSACAGVFFVLDGLTGGGRTRRRWLFLAGLLCGGGTWATHFVAMLGYEPGLPIGYHLGWTVASALIGVMGAWAALEIFDRFEHGVGQIAAGLVLGGSIVALHYVGMAGVQAAASQQWALDLVIPSFLLCAGFAVGALHAYRLAPRRYRIFAGAGLLLLSIVSLHFTAMGALTLAPDPRLAMPSQALDRNMLGITVASGAAAALFMGVLMALADRRITATELASAQRAAAMALHDALTGLPNRRNLRETLERFLANSRPCFAVVAVDLDRFKPVNDLYGHAVGDEVLVKAARHLAEAAAPDGFAARLGGDEFVLVLPFESEDGLIHQLSSLIAQFAHPLRLGKNEVRVGATFGVAIAPADGDDADTLLRRADVALYRAKGEGRGRFSFFEHGMDARVMERAALERDLRVAIAEDEIIPYYQPLVQLASGSIGGYEVLVRWPHTERGLIQPDCFIPIAVETGLINEMTFNVLRRACRETLNWPGAPRISLNIAPVQLHDRALPQKLLQVLSECGFPPARLEIELTEDALVADLDAARTLLASLKNMDVRISLDDFGTGYSSLRHLRELPFDSLKIDRSFIRNMSDDEEALAIVKTIVQMAKSLGLGVTAEGIETERQAAELEALGCERGQGYHLGRPAASFAAELEPRARDERLRAGAHPRS
ncbi:MAG TPA: EAL domain-containing protein [Vitreimonas sp.]|uniref:putative bifunctional diguanylate cyclase/phosphodiesterase n=1 Tax=Vitreimonas sp. TaxID=3069702 RepID=UPI002D2DB57D|nr:EAL domain-containing protein [Vitreimonas sp.]HYD86051.1 EAL domain-containing protein [Vitreimonas sp.]